MAVVIIEPDQAKAAQMQTLPIAAGRCWYAPAVADALGMGNRESLGALIEQIMDPGLQRRTIKKDIERSSVEVAEVDGCPWVVKTYRAPVWITRLYQCVKRTPAWREWRGAFELAAAGCRANPPLALIDNPSQGIDAQSLIMTHIEGRTLGPSLKQWAKLEGQEPIIKQRRLALAEALGRQLGRIMQAGLVNRDHKPANLMVDPTCEQQGAEPVIIDPLGVRRRTDENRRLRMLATFLRTALNDRPFTFREALTLVRAFADTGVDLGAGRKRRVRWIIDQTIARLPADAGQRLLQSFKP